MGSRFLFCILSASLAQAGLAMFAGSSHCEVAFRGGLLALVVSGYAKEEVTSLCLGVLWCLRTPQHFLDFGFSYVWV